MLNLKNVTASYGRTTALREISLHVKSGEIVALVGANGAGKSTVLNTISGVVPAKKGTVTYQDKEIHRHSPDKIVRMGLCQVPEGRQLFAPLSIKDNLLLGTYSRSRHDKKAHLKDDLDRVYSIFPILAERSEQRAGTLSGGEQQMLAIGRALMARPKMLLLDEPSMGLAPMVLAEIFRAIAEFRRLGLTVLLVEQNARWALNIADRGYVLETGKVILEGTADELMKNKQIQHAYLGKTTAV